MNFCFCSQHRSTPSRHQWALRGTRGWACRRPTRKSGWYEPGDSRDVNISIEKFLGRKRSLDPFLKKIGIQKEQTAAKMAQKN
jgi:hypothetical protein